MFLRYDVNVLVRNLRAPTALRRGRTDQLTEINDLSTRTICRGLNTRLIVSTRPTPSIQRSGSRAFSSSAKLVLPSQPDNQNEDVEAPKPPLAIVFTDIVKSTAIWEKDSDTMAEAMTIHDNLIRQTTRLHQGYEVKQNGDGFMIAFQSAVCALRFCLDIQVQLQEQDWPARLLELGPAQPVVDEATRDDSQTDHVLWKGLRVRMSAHFGEVVCNWNDVIHRMDYLGPAVNRAARFVSVCEGGQVIVSEDFLNALRSERTGALAENGPLYKRNEGEGQQQELRQLDLEGLVGTDFELCVLGERHFKGVPEKQKLFFIVPKSLHGRLEYFPKHTYVQASKGNLV